MDPTQIPAGAPGPSPSGAAPPMESPMQSPQNPAGEKAMAAVNVKMAMDVLTNVLPIFGVTSEEGKTIMEVLNKMARQFGHETSKHQDAVPAEVAALVASLKGGPGAPPPTPVAGGMPPMAAPAPGA